MAQPRPRSHPPVHPPAHSPTGHADAYGGGACAPVQRRLVRLPRSCRTRDRSRRSARRHRACPDPPEADRHPCHSILSSRVTDRARNRARRRRYFPLPTSVAGKGQGASIRRAETDRAACGLPVMHDRAPAECRRSVSRGNGGRQALRPQ
ncbi:hypothetical protein GGD81_004625 [Rhodobium orientis]|nr:hypothetical protein [Rhodobium orientis]